MQAVGGYVLIQHLVGQTRKRSSGLEVPTELADRFLRGTVVSASEEIGKKEFGLQAGQDVLYDKMAGHEIKGIDGQEYKVITVRDIAVILDN
jgi:co-chaperonin GroES (HSP10)